MAKARAVGRWLWRLAWPSAIVAVVGWGVLVFALGLEFLGPRTTFIVLRGLVYGTLLMVVVGLPVVLIQAAVTWACRRFIASRPLGWTCVFAPALLVSLGLAAWAMWHATANARFHEMTGMAPPRSVYGIEFRDDSGWDEADVRLSFWVSREDLHVLPPRGGWPAWMAVDPTVTVTDEAGETGRATVKVLIRYNYD